MEPISYGLMHDASKMLSYKPATNLRSEPSTTPYTGLEITLSTFVTCIPCELRDMADFTYVTSITSATASSCEEVGDSTEEVSRGAIMSNKGKGPISTEISSRDTSEKFVLGPSNGTSDAIG